MGLGLPHHPHGSPPHLTQSPGAHLDEDREEKGEQTLGAPRPLSRVTKAQRGFLVKTGNQDAAGSPLQKQLLWRLGPGSLMLSPCLSLPPPLTHTHHSDNQEQRLSSENAPQGLHSTPHPPTTQPLNGKAPSLGHLPLKTDKKNPPLPHNRRPPPAPRTVRPRSLQAESRTRVHSVLIPLQPLPRSRKGSVRQAVSPGSPAGILI